MRCQIVISTVGNEIIIFGTYTPLGLVIHWYALPPVSVHDDAAPVAPSIPAKETRVRKGKRRSGERRRRRRRTQFLPHPHPVIRRRRRCPVSASFCTAPAVPLSLPRSSFLLSIYPPIRSPDSLAPAEKEGAVLASLPLALLPPSSCF